MGSCRSGVSQDGALQTMGDGFVVVLRSGPCSQVDLVLALLLTSCVFLGK